MDRLVSPGGCPWDAEQTHESLLPYLVEETYEVVDAVGEGDDAHLAEELGDVLLQVLFHSRVASGRGAFGIDDVAKGLEGKLVRRHPHVFASGDLRPDHADAAAVQAGWDVIKAAERPGRGPFDGIPSHLPALARAQKVLGRLERLGVADTTPREGTQRDVNGDVAGDTPGEIAEALLAVVARARRAGVDAEQALSVHVRALQARAVENGAGADGPARD